MRSRWTLNRSRMSKQRINLLRFCLASENAPHKSEPFCSHMSLTPRAQNGKYLHLAQSGPGSFYTTLGAVTVVAQISMTILWQRGWILWEAEVSGGTGGGFCSFGCYRKLIRDLEENHAIWQLLHICTNKSVKAKTFLQLCRLESYQKPKSWQKKKSRIIGCGVWCA